LPQSMIQEQRARLTSLFDTSSAADAPTAYYALYHDPKRSTLFVKSDEQGKASGFVGRFQTGVDLFRALVMLRCQTPESAADLLAEALVVGRSYLLFVSQDQVPLVGGSLQISNERTLAIYKLDASRFSPVINVLVVNKTAPDSTPRAEIHSGGLQAAAGVNWQSPNFAEIYVHTEAEARQRGWGRSVAAAVTDRVLGSGRLPLYLVESNNEASISLAESLNYVDSGARQSFAEAVYLGHPGKTSA
jgi:hypothetical protein